MRSILETGSVQYEHMVRSLVIGANWREMTSACLPKGLASVRYNEKRRWLCLNIGRVSASLLHCISEFIQGRVHAINCIDIEALAFCKANEFGKRNTCFFH